MRLRSTIMAFVLALTLLPALPARADDSDLAKATAAISWLTAQTNSAGMLESSAGYGDVGLTLDAVLAGAAAGAPTTTLNRWLDGAATVFRERVIYSTGGRDTGTIAKAVVALHLAGRSTTSYAGVNPLALTSESLSLGAAAGWAGEPGKPTNVNAFGQAYVMLALARTGTVPAATVSFLASRQCSDGGFPMYFTQTSCTTSDPDGTAMLVMALRGALADGVPGAKAPLDRATAYLVAAQHSNGSYAATMPDGTRPENANTSGLAAAALADVAPYSVAKVRSWMATMQLTGGADTGAVAYNAADRARGLVSTTTRPRWVRATTQGLLAFAPVSFHSMLGFSVYSREGVHTVNGRQWRTRCEPYSQTTRCFTDIWATKVTEQDGRFVVQTGWVFNNLSYLPSPRSLWVTNPLGGKGQVKAAFSWTAADGRKWRVECDSAVTGWGGCRSYIWARVIVNTASAGQPARYTWDQDWVFNNLVYFS